MHVNWSKHSWLPKISISFKIHLYSPFYFFIRVKTYKSGERICYFFKHVKITTTLNQQIWTCYDTIVVVLHQNSYTYSSLHQYFSFPISQVIIPLMMCLCSKINYICMPFSSSITFDRELMIPGRSLWLVIKLLFLLTDILLESLEDKWPTPKTQEELQFKKKSFLDWVYDCTNNTYHDGE